MKQLQKSLHYYEQVYHTIRQMIFDGVFVPGERVYEAKIARDFEVSRSPVREAVRALIKDGLLVMDDKSQISVYNPTMKDVEEIYQCRMALESLAARLSAQLATDDEHREIEASLKETEELVKENNKTKNSRIISLNSRFHELVTEYSQNKRLQQQIEDLRSLTYYLRLVNFQGEHRAKVILNEHKVIYEFIKKRDGYRAAAAMEEHISNDLNHLKDIIIKKR